MAEEIEQTSIEDAIQGELVEEPKAKRGRKPRIVNEPEAEVETSMIVRQPQAAPLTLFGTSDPVAVLHEAARVASALKSVLVRQRLYAAIGNRNYVTVEGWTLLGSMLGVFPQIEWTRRIKGTDSDYSKDGWEARAIAVVASTGTTIGAAEAMCTRQESTWRARDDYALRGMAQTRAISRALRGPLDFVVKLAGFESTPAEEMPRA